MTNMEDDIISKISRMLEIGGTMLAQHCDVCGAPMFRYQGRVMCPVCESVNDPRARLQQKSEQKLTLENKAAAVSPEGPSKKVLLEDTIKTGPYAQVSIPGSGGDTTVPSDSSPVTELESLLMEKMVSFARSMRSEDDVRKISDHMDMIERGLSIIEKMRKIL
ncbi:MAG: hypothetical protein JW705_04590 [Methanosarcinaceae archaeon]|nr:hypothetical protein [Methanosarcinaceae archaeon]